MSKAKYKETLSMSRQQAADYLSSLGTDLASGKPFTLTIGSQTLTLDFPEPLTLEVQAKIEEAGDELELEIKWPKHLPKSGPGNGNFSQTHVQP